MDVRLARRMAEVRPSAIRDLLRLGADPELISFGGGYPDPDLFPLEELRQVMDELLSIGRFSRNPQPAHQRDAESCDEDPVQNDGAIVCLTLPHAYAPLLPLSGSNQRPMSLHESRP